MKKPIKCDDHKCRKLAVCGYDLGIFVMALCREHAVKFALNRGSGKFIELDDLNPACLEMLGKERL